MMWGIIDKATFGDNHDNEKKDILVVHKHFC